MGADGSTQYFTDNVPKQAEGKPSDTVESGVTSGSERHLHTNWQIWPPVVGFVALFVALA